MSPLAGRCARESARHGQSQGITVNLFGRTKNSSVEGWRSRASSRESLVVRVSIRVPACGQAWGLPVTPIRGVHVCLWSPPTLDRASLCDQQDTVEMKDVTRRLGSETGAFCLLSREAATIV